MQHLEQYKKDFIEFLIEAQSLKFGEFTLKSGRVAPYFINMGSFHTGEHLNKLGSFYAAALQQSGVACDVIFGPAYKGIPLAVITAAAMSREHKQNVSYAFNRKETKDYGMKDRIVGASLTAETRVVLVDDVITAGTAIRETAELLKENGNPRLAGILIAVNRMEKNNDGINALAAVEDEIGCPVFAIVTLEEIVDYLQGRAVQGKVWIDENMKGKIREYRAQYGV